jgi:hypothetical protein
MRSRPPGRKVRHRPQAVAQVCNHIFKNPFESRIAAQGALPRKDRHKVGGDGGGKGCKIARRPLGGVGRVTSVAQPVP